MESLNKSEVLLIFTYAPAGLGHLRVTDALRDGLDEKINSVLLGAEDTSITYWHRLSSVSPIFKRILDWITTGKNGYWFYDLYIWMLGLSSGRLYKQMEYLLLQQWEAKKTVVVVSTHFGLAHQIATIKNKLEEKHNINLLLVVQVTDATSMAPWYVEGADLISVPSQKVKEELLEYAKSRGRKKADIMVLPYPINPLLGKTLSHDNYQKRLKQYSHDSESKIKIAIPISGAAVGLDYYDKLILELKKINDRFEIFIVARSNAHTKAFIKKMKNREGLSVIENKEDVKVVESYQKLYEDEIIGLEIVKPSEQAFKALFRQNQRGGSILLFNKPVGKQEEDNLNFLIEHGLLPSQEDQYKLKSYATEGKTPDKVECRECIKRAENWRAIRLADDPKTDAVIINWCIKMGIFEIISKHNENPGLKNVELASNGVEQFWEKVDELIKSTERN